jgi:phenylpyruvate tautomerase PptA (4-oxalocrotonate tautomerase family)
MPYLCIRTNKAIDDQPGQALLKKASALVARELDKPEEYVMVTLEAGRPMLLAGNAEPAAFLELRAIGLPANKTGELSRVLCDLVESELGVPRERVFINFADIPANLWGWNGETF